MKLKKDLIIIKVYTGPIENNVKYYSNVFLNIMGNPVMMGFMISTHFI